MMNKKVAILLSTFNGEKYIAAQLDSVLNQTYDNIEIFVRDDGSNDETIRILRKYADENKIKFFQEENVGFVKSFFKLLSYCQDADYYAFCDQDDVWYPNKVAYAINVLNKNDSSIPLLYYSNYDYYDENLEFKGHSKVCGEVPSFRNSLVDCITLGFCTVINRTTRNLMVENNLKCSCGHDWTAYMICSGFGKIVFDPRVTVKYRRHGGNVSPGGKHFFAFQIWRFKKFFINDYFVNIQQQLVEYDNNFFDYLRKEDKDVLRLFTNKPRSIFRRNMKVFYPKWFRQNFSDEVLLRILFLIGQL